MASVARVRRIALQQVWCNAVNCCCTAAILAGEPAIPRARTASASGFASMLYQFGHDEVAAQDVGQAEPGLQLLRLHDAVAQPVHCVRDHHRPLEQRGFQRGRAARDQRRGRTRRAPRASGRSTIVRPSPSPAALAASSIAARQAGSAGTTHRMPGRAWRTRTAASKNPGPGTAPRSHGCPAGWPAPRHPPAGPTRAARPRGRAPWGSRQRADARHTSPRSHAAPAIAARTETGTAHGPRCAGSGGCGRAARPRSTGRRNAPS